MIYLYSAQKVLKEMADLRLKPNVLMRWNWRGWIWMRLLIIAWWPLLSRACVVEGSTYTCIYIEDLLIKLVKMFPRPKLQSVLMLKNYDLGIGILKDGTFGLYHNWHMFLLEMLHSICIVLSKFILSWKLTLTVAMHIFTPRRFSRATFQFMWYALRLTDGAEFIYGQRNTAIYISGFC
jgi:hypothetical protein